MIKRIDIRPYPCVLYVTNTKEEYLTLRAKYTDDPIDLDSASGISSDYHGGTVHVVGVFELPATNILVHELAHVCIKVCGAMGIPIDNRTSEAFCYLMGDLMGECAEVFLPQTEEEPN